jgi:hypothetical protein
MLPWWYPCAMHQQSPGVALPFEQWLFYHWRIVLGGPRRQAPAPAAS